MKRILSVVLTGAAVAILGYVALRFPWSATARALAGASLPWVIVAAGANLGSLVAKGGTWHLILRREAPVRAVRSVLATIVGAAAGSVAPSVTGEAFRLRHLVAEEPVSVKIALAAVAAARALEAIALVGIIVAGSALLPPVGWARSVRLGAVVAAAALVLLSRRRVLGRVSPRLAAYLHGSGMRGALALAALGWIAQWAAYYAACRAVSLPQPIALSLTALIVSNIGGVVRLTPGNVGVLQAAFALTAVALGVAAPAAVAAAFLLQAVQIIPVVAAGLAIVTAGRLRRRRGGSRAPIPA